jgi:acetate kinase
LKLRLLDDADNLTAAKDVLTSEQTERGRELERFLDEHPQIDAAGHRVVHGGARYRQPVVLDDDVEAMLQTLADLAPLHNPPSLASIRLLKALRPTLPQVACFDTAFHADMPAKASTYAVPRAWRDGWGVRRFGFHGLSHAYASRRAADLLDRPREGLRLVTAHIGSGASLAAVISGRSIDTTMGFTPLEGLVMATRSGSIDPGLVLWVQRHGGLTGEEVDEALEHHSGLRGLWGRSGDLREVIAAADGGDESALLAYEVYVYRLQTSIAAMTAAMGGLDGLVFTGGAGEASARLRGDVCAALGFLGVWLDLVRNTACHGDDVVSPPNSAASVAVVLAREDLEIARHVRDLLR